MIVTKMLYAAPVWLKDNFHMFKDFWSRMILKISGSQYHPPRVLTEAALGIPPLELTYEIISMKFVLKAVNDNYLSGLIYQLETARYHPFYNHILATKLFIHWKLKITTSNYREISLTNLDKSTFLYTKAEIDMYQAFKSTNLIQNSIPEDDKEFFITTNMEITHNHNKQLFPRKSSRYTDVNVMDILHGHCNRFNNFKHSILKNEPHLQMGHSKYCPICQLTPDTSYHQLYECPRYNSNYREQLPQINNPVLFGFELIMMKQPDILKALRIMAQIMNDPSG